MSKADEAIKRHDKGYNCSQAVACVFAEELGLDEALLFKLNEGFGAGMGSGRGVCGALSGVVMLAGLVNSDGSIDSAGSTKSSTYKIAAAMQKEFVSRAERLICRDIKTGNDGKAFTSCADCIRIATEIAEETLKL